MALVNDEYDALRRLAADHWLDPASQTWLTAVKDHLEPCEALLREIRTTFDEKYAQDNNSGYYYAVDVPIVKNWLSKAAALLGPAPKKDT